MTNYRDRFQNTNSTRLGNITSGIDEERKRKLFSAQGFKVLSPQDDSLYLTEAESERFVKAYIKQKSRYIPEIDYKDPSTFAFFGSAERYYEDAVKNIYNTYPYDGSKAEKMEWSLSASYIDLYVLEHDYPKSTGHVNFVRSTVTVDGTPYQTVQTPRYIKFFGGPQKNTIYNSSKNRESGLKISGETGNTVEFWLKKNSDSWCSSARKEIILDVASTSSTSANTGRLTVEVENPSDATNSPFMFTYMSGTTGTSATGLRLGSTAVTKASVGDGNWHHYAISAQTSGSSTVFKLYIDGQLDYTTTGAYTIGPIKDFLNGTLGASESFGNGAAATGLGQLSASLDEFRYWKTARTEKEIGRFWYQPIHGGTDGDHTNANLGIYYKFNEGKTGVQKHDKVILDYSGRINNGQVINWSSAFRDTGSGIESSSNLPETNYVEPKDPIMNPVNILVTNSLEQLRKIGQSHDLQNQASLLNTVPEHFRTQDTNLFPKLLQVLSSTFDDLFLKIKSLPDMKSYSYSDFFENTGSYRKAQDNSFLLGCEDTSLVEFTGNNFKPWTKNILEHYGLVSTDIFSNATIFENFFNRTEQLTFDHNLEEVKRGILSNIHKNLVHILKSKGTESSFRNLIRCFGVDDELIKMTVYGQNEEYKLELKPIYSSKRKKALSFEKKNFQGTVHQRIDGTDSLNYITGSSTRTPFTLEANIMFPKYTEDTNPKILDSSLFGVHSVQGSSTPSDPLKFDAQDSGSFQVYFKKRTKSSRDGYFVLTSSTGVISEVTSSFLPAVYDNEHWNISLSIGAKSDIDFNVVPDNASTEYLVELRGYNYDLDVLKESFHISASLDRDDYIKISEQDKAVFLGSHKTNFSGTHQMSSDIRVFGFNVWKDVLSDEELKEHAKNPETFGRKKPHTISNFDTGINLEAKDSLILRWQFENLTASVASVANVEDFTSGSATAIATDPVVGYKYPGKGIDLPDTDVTITQEFIPSVTYHGIDNVYSSDRIKIKTQEIDKFEPDSRPVTYFYSFEKSMYQIISKEMVNFFAGIVGYNNLIGEPVNKYRSKYKAMEKVREKFFANIANDIDLEKFVEYYRWVDSSLSKLLNQLIPASANFDSEIKDVVESHILERNKYKHQPPTIEFKDPADRTFSILGVNELLYDWEHGHFSNNEEEHCLWQKERSPRSAEREVLRRISITEVDGSTYALRRLTKPYKISGQFTRPIGTGFNSKANKSVELYKIINSGKNLLLTSSNIVNSNICTDVLNPNKLTTHKIKIDTSSTDGYLDVDSDMILPFTLVSSSAGDNLTALRRDIQVSNNHLALGRSGESPLRGPFTRAHVGAMAHNRVALGTLDEDRPEAYRIFSPITSSTAFGSQVSMNSIRFTSTSTSFVTVPDSDDLSFGNSPTVPSASANTFSFSMWVKPDDTAINAERQSRSVADLYSHLLTKVADRTVEAEREYSIGFHRGFSDLVPFVRIWSGGATYLILRGKSLTPNTWLHVVWTFNGDFQNGDNNNFKLYINGTRAGTPASRFSTVQGTSIPWGDARYSMPNTTSTFTMGANTGNPNAYSDMKFIGDLADVAIFKDRELTQAEVTELYNAGTISDVSSHSRYADVVAWYKAGDDQDHVSNAGGIKDYKGSNHGTGTDITFVSASLGSAAEETTTFFPTPGLVNITTASVRTPKSQFYNHIEAASHINIRNIKHDTGSLLLGNYNKIHEVVRTSGRSSNNSYFVDSLGAYVKQEGELALVPGFVDAAKPNRPRSGHVIVNKFSAPGGPETAGSFASDIESGELSVYNTINYRNLNKRNLLTRLHGEVSERFGYRTGSTSQGSLHKTYRNPMRQTGSSGKEVEFDNFLISHQIPTNDFSYSWITASANEGVYSFLSKNENIGHQHLLGRIGTGSLKLTSSAETISFLSSSEMIQNLDFAQMNYYATSSLSTSTNTLSYINTDLNSQILNLQGPYGWPTWKQLRGQEHPIVRHQKRNSEFTLVQRNTLRSNFSQDLFPSPYDGYNWSLNPDLSKIDNTTKTSARHIISYSEIMVTNKLNPLTITLHGASATDLTTETISQQKLDSLWRNDETSLVSLNAASLDAERTDFLTSYLSTRLASLKTTYGNNQTGFANPLLNIKAFPYEDKHNKNAQKIIQAAATVADQNADVFTTEINYIETVYPREVNTFRKSSRYRENFDFYSWKSNRNDRDVELGGNVAYASSVIHSGTLSIIPAVTFNSFNYKSTNGFGIDAYDVTSPSGSIKVPKHISTSKWPLDARKNFAGTPQSLTASYMQLGNDYFRGLATQGTRNEGVLQNDYNTYLLGQNSLYGTPPPAPLYTRRVPQKRIMPSSISYAQEQYNQYAITSSLESVGSITNESTGQNWDNRSFPTDFSISLWFKEPQEENNAVGLISYHESGDYTDYQWTIYRAFDNGFNVVRFIIYGSSGGYRMISAYYTHSNYVGEWINLVVTNDRSDTISSNNDGLDIYFNNNKVTHDTFNPSFGGTFGSNIKTISSPMLSVLSPPASAGGTGNNVEMADVLMFNTKLSDAEVTELYNGGTLYDPLQHSQQSSIILNLRMGDGDNDTGAVAYDYAGNRSFTKTNTQTVLAPTLPTGRVFVRRNGGTQEYLAGEAQWLAAEQSKAAPFANNMNRHNEDLRALGQDFSLIPEFKISDHVEEVLNQDFGDYRKTSEKSAWLSLTGAIYNESTNQVALSSKFYETYSTSDFMKYFSAVRKDVKQAGLGTPSKLTLRCNAVMKFVPYRGFYPAERSLQIGEIFSRGYMPDPVITTSADSNEFVSSPIDGIKAKIRSNMQQSLKPLMSPGILYNSIKSGIAVDYPLFGGVSNDSTLEIYKSGSRSQSLSHMSGFSPSLTSLDYLTGTLVNGTVDDGIPRLSGSVHRRVVFEDLLNPDSLVGQPIYDQEPHPSASIYVADSMLTRIVDYPYKFGQLEDSSNLQDLLVTSYRPRNSLSETLNPYKLAVQNFCAETVEFFLRDNSLTTIESAEVHPLLELDKEYKMRIYMRNNSLRMYDRHSAFGPPVDEDGDVGLNFTSSVEVTTTIPAQAAKLSLQPPAGIAMYALPSLAGSSALATDYNSLPHFSLTASAAINTARISVFHPTYFQPWTYHSATEASMLLSHADNGFGFGLDPTASGKAYIHSGSSSGINVYVDVSSVPAGQTGQGLNHLTRLMYLGIHYYSANWFGNLDMTVAAPSEVGATFSPFEVEFTQLSQDVAGNTATTPSAGISDWAQIPSSFSGGAGASTVSELSSSVATVRDTHAFSPFVPPFLDPGSEPYVEISFTPSADSGGTKNYTLPEIWAYSNYEYVNFPTKPSNSGKNSNYQQAMSLSASLDINRAVLYDASEAEPASERNQRLRWTIQTKWETPILNFIDATGSALNLSTMAVEQITGSSPWQNRQWGNFYKSSSLESTSKPYLTSSLGMWHQYGDLPKGSKEGYTLSVESVPSHPDSQQLAELVGFIDKGQKVEKRLGTISEKKVVSEAVVAIPFIQPAAPGLDLKFFQVDPRALRKAAKLNEKKKKDFEQQILGLNRADNAPERRVYMRFEEDYLEFYNSPGQSAVESLAYQLRMMDKFILPPQFDYYTNPENNIRPMMYVFQFHAEFSRADLGNIWQNLSPKSFTSCASPRVPSVGQNTHLSANTQDVQYISNFFDNANQTLCPFDASDFLQNKKVRWLVFKAKQRGEADLYNVKRKSLEGIKKLGKNLNDSLSSFKSDPLFASQRYSYNWPYDFFSIVELVKLETKVDFFKNATVRSEGEEE